MIAVFVLEASGVPIAPAVLGLFAVVIVGFGVAVGARHRWATALRVVALPGAAGLLAGAAVMGAGLTFTGAGSPWSEQTYLPGLIVLCVVLLGLHLLLHDHRRMATAEHPGEPRERAR